MKRNELIINIIGPVMSEKGFELETDKRGYWRWKKIVLGEKEEVTLMDIQQIVRLTIGKAKRGVMFLSGDQLLHTLDNPRTKSEDWFYYKSEGSQKQEIYENILKDIRDILVKNCDRILEEHAEKIKNAVPNKRHFEKLRDNYEKIAEEYSQKYVTDNKDILEILDVIMYQISRMFEEPLQDVENDLLGFAAIMYYEVQKQYGGKLEVDEELENIMLVDVGKNKTSYSFLLDIFGMWKNREWFNQYRENFVWWYNSEK